ncbi:MAG: TadE/TadG family type IV pilus assembly protein [Phyllobacterium sp.]
MSPTDPHTANHRQTIGLLARFGRDQKGVAAVEFAIVVPILLLLFLGTVEVATGLETNKKVDRISSMVGDLIAQQSSVTESDISAIFDIGQSTLAPYKTDVARIIVTAIKIDDVEGANPPARVQWSLQKTGSSTSTPYVKNSLVDIPTSLRTKGAFLIKVETKLAYLPLIAWTINDTVTTHTGITGKGISMAETYYLRPRLVEIIPCSDCR